MTLIDFYNKYKKFITVSSVTFRKYVDRGNFKGVKIVKNLKRKTYLVTDEKLLLNEWLSN